MLRVFQTRDHLSLMGGITLDGRLFTLLRDEALTGVESVRFIKPLQYWLGPRLLAIWDGSPIHRGDEVQTFLADGGSKAVHIERLPGYAPDLNPTEGVWQLLKDVEMRNLCCSDFSHLQHELLLAILRVRRKPHLIQACFPGAGLAV